MIEAEAPIIAHHRAISMWKPQLGDYITRSGWFRVSYGLVNSISRDGTHAEILFAGTPFLLLTLQDNEMKESSESIAISDIKNKRKASWAVLQHDTKSNCCIWYI